MSYGGNVLGGGECPDPEGIITVCLDDVLMHLLVIAGLKCETVENVGDCFLVNCFAMN